MLFLIIATNFFFCLVCSFQGLVLTEVVNLKFGLLLHSAHAKLGSREKGDNRVPCTCGASYAGQTGRTVNIGDTSGREIQTNLHWHTIAGWQDTRSSFTEQRCSLNLLAGTWGLGDHLWKLLSHRAQSFKTMGLNYVMLGSWHMKCWHHEGVLNLKYLWPLPMEARYEASKVERCFVARHFPYFLCLVFIQRHWLLANES